MEEVIIELLHERNTKNKVLYKSDDKDRVVDNIYISKEAFQGEEPPVKIVIKIS